MKRMSVICIVLLISSFQLKGEEFLGSKKNLLLFGSYTPSGIFGSTSWASWLSDCCQPR